jgi:hypothetical protein
MKLVSKSDEAAHAQPFAFALAFAPALVLAFVLAFAFALAFLSVIPSTARNLLFAVPPPQTLPSKDFAR